jgi:hypothetical protein
MLEIGVWTEGQREENGELRREQIEKVIEEIVVKKTGGRCEEKSKRIE